MKRFLNVYVIVGLFLFIFGGLIIFVILNNKNEEDNNSLAKSKNAKVEVLCSALERSDCYESYKDILDKISYSLDDSTFTFYTLEPMGYNPDVKIDYEKGIIYIYLEDECPSCKYQEEVKKISINDYFPDKFVSVEVYLNGKLLNLSWSE